MSTKANTTKIGIFVLLGVALLVGGLLAFGARSYFTPKQKAETAIVGEVSGLSVGSRVELRGVSIGKVTEITFAWNVYPQTKSNLIVVVFEIEGSLIPLPSGMTMKAAVNQAIARGMRAMVKSQGITGTSILALDILDPKAYPPPSIDFTPRHFYIPSAPPQFTRLLESVEKTMGHLEQLDVASISQNATNTLAAVRELVDKLAQVDIGTVTTNVNNLLVEVKGSSAKLTEVIQDVQKNINGLNLDAVSKNADGLITGLRETNLKLQGVLDKVDAVPMQQTVADLQEVFQSLNVVLVELKDYPSGFLFGKPPRPVESLEPADK